MSTVVASQFRKTCLPCTTAKRRCDKGWPVCHRCIKNRIECQYPSTRRYARTAKIQESNNRASQTFPASSSEQTGALEASAPRQYAQDIITVDHETLRDLRQTSRSPTLPPDLDGPGGLAIEGSAITIEPYDPNWHLGPDAWSIQHWPNAASTGVSSSVHASTLKRWTDTVRAWLRRWIDLGHNPFIHHYLYFETGLPSPLQDAWMSVATYHAKTRDNEETTLSIIEAKAGNLLLERLLSDECFTTMSPLDVQTRLAHVQSLFIFQFIRLFDGDIRQRALAEREIPTLYTWCEQLWHSASEGADACLQGANFDTAGASYSTDSGWKSWVISESIRRIYLLVHFMLGAYLTLRDGSTECTGVPKFTTRRGLWDANSSSDWAATLHNKGPLFTSLFRIGRLMSLENGAIDEFSIDMLAASVGLQTPGRSLLG